MIPHALVERFRGDLLDWSEQHLREFPWRSEDFTPYEVLVAEIFLKQTRAETVEKVLPEFFELYPELVDLSNASKQELIEVIRPLGLYNDRSEALLEIGRRLEASEVPNDYDGLQDLPQVGRYVANATLCFGFHEDRPIVDSNVRRVYGRLFEKYSVDDLSDNELWAFSADLLPARNVRQYNMAILDFGAKLCTASSPSCDECFAREYCGYYQRIRDPEPGNN